MCDCRNFNSYTVVRKKKENVIKRFIKNLLSFQRKSKEYYIRLHMPSDYGKPRRTEKLK